MSESAPVRSYRFDSLDTGAVFLGLGWLQCGLLGAGLAVSVVLLTSGVPLAVASVPAAVGAAACFLRVGGRPAWEWFGPIVASVHLRLGRKQLWLAPLPLLVRAGGEQPQLPACLRGITLVELSFGDGVIGAIHDRVAQTITVVIPAGNDLFLTLPSEVQDRLLDGWGELFGQVATVGAPVITVGWSHTTMPISGAPSPAWPEGESRGDVADVAADSYAELLAEAWSELFDHDNVLFATVRCRRDDVRVGWDGPPSHPLLASAVDAVTHAADSAGIAVSAPLTAPELRSLLRRRIDPFHAGVVDDDQGLACRLGLVSAAAAGPMALEARWKAVRIDSVWHRVYWLAGYPRSQQTSSWLEPLLSTPGVARVATVYLFPIPAYRSHRKIERDLVKLESDAAVKEERGRRVNARHHRATQSLLEREAELVSGHPEVGYTGLISVSGLDEDQLMENCVRVEQLAREVGVELRTLEARQDLGWASSLPFGVAPRHLLS